MSEGDGPRKGGIVGTEGRVTGDGARTGPRDGIWGRVEGTGLLWVDVHMAFTRTRLRLNHDARTPRLYMYKGPSVSRRARSPAVHRGDGPPVCRGADGDGDGVVLLCVTLAVCGVGWP